MPITGFSPYTYGALIRKQNNGNGIPAAKLEGVRHDGLSADAVSGKTGNRMMTPPDNATETEDFSQ